MASTSTSTPPPPPPVRACLFDMDGLLLDTEDLYTQCANEVLRKYGRPDLPWNIKAKLQGRPAREALVLFHEWAQLPISNDEYLAQQSALQAIHFPAAKPLPGVLDLLSTLSTSTSTSPPSSSSATTTTSAAARQSPIHLALATSSHARTFALKTDHLAPLFTAHFPTPHARVLGDDPRIGPGRGKPLPDIYLLALSLVNARIRASRQQEGKEEEEQEEAEITPAECLVFEDSVPGVEAGRRAGMQVVWCPHAGLREEYRGREEEVLAGLMGEHSATSAAAAAAAASGGAVGKEEEDEKVAKVWNGGGSAEGRTGGAADGKPGVKGDGWAVLLDSLEDFPYGRFGIVPSSTK